MSIESVLIKISEKFEKWPDSHNILDVHMYILLKYIWISLAIFKVSERFEKPYDSIIGFYSSVQCCSMAFTSILVAMKVLVPLYHWYFSDMQI